MTSGMERKNRPSAADCIFTNDFTNETDCCGAIIPTPGKPYSDALLELETRISKGFSGFPGGTPATRNRTAGSGISAQAAPSSGKSGLVTRLFPLRKRIRSPLPAGEDPETAPSFAATTRPPTPSPPGILASMSRWMTCSPWCGTAPCGTAAPSSKAENAPTGSTTQRQIPPRPSPDSTEVLIFPGRAGTRMGSTGSNRIPPPRSPGSGSASWSPEPPKTQKERSRLAPLFLI